MYEVTLSRTLYILKESSQSEDSFGCIIFSVGERKFSPNAKFLQKNRNTHQISCII